MAVFGHVLQVVDKFSATFQRWQTRLDVFSRRTDETTPKLAVMAVAFAGLAAAGAAAISKMVSSFTQLEDRLAELEIATTTTFQTMGEALETSLEKAVSFSGQFVFSANEVLAASVTLAQAGLNVVEVQGAVEQTAFLAAGGLGELGQTAELVATLLNTVGQAGELRFLPPMEKAARITDSIALAVTKFQATLPTFTESLKFAAGPASELGISIDELNAALGTLNTAGLRGSLAGTALSNVFAQIGAATEKLGLDPRAFTAANGEITSLSDVLGELEKRLPIAAQERFNALIDAFGIRAARGLVVLLQNSDALRRNTEDLQNASGAAERLGRTFGGTTNREIQVLKNNFQNFLAILGRSFTPIIGAVVRAFNAVTRAFVSAPPTIKAFIAALVAGTTIFAGFVAVSKGLALAQLALKTIFEAAAAASKIASAATKSQTANIQEQTIATQALAGATAAQAQATAAVAIPAYVRWIGVLASTVSAVGGVVAIIGAVAVAYNSFSSASEAARRSIDATNTKFESLSSSLARLKTDFETLNRVASNPISVRVEAPEVLAFSDLVDVGGAREAGREVQAVRQEIVQLNLRTAELQKQTGSFERVARIFTPFVDEMSEADEATVPLILRMSELRDKADDLQQSVGKIDLSEGSAQFAEMRQRILELNEASLQALVLDRFRQSVEDSTGSAAQASEVLEQVESGMRDLGIEAGRTGQVLAAIGDELDREFRARGFDVSIAKVQQLQKAVEAGRVEFQSLAEGADLGTGKAEFAPELQKTFEIIQENEDQIRAGSSALGAQINLLKDANGKWVEMKGHEKDVASVALQIEQVFSAISQGIIPEAARAGLLQVLERQIDDIGSAASRSEQRVATLLKASKEGAAPDVGNLAEAAAIQGEVVDGLTEGLRLLKERRAELSRQAVLEASDPVRREEINKKLFEAVQLEAEFGQRLEESRAGIEEARRAIVERAQIAFPGAAEALGIDEDRPLKLKAEVAIEEQGKIDQQIRDLGARLKAAQAQAFAFEKEGKAAEADKFRREIVAPLLREAEGLEALKIRVGFEAKGDLERLRDLVGAEEFDARMNLRAEPKTLADALRAGFDAFLREGTVESFGAAVGGKLRQAVSSSLSEALTQAFLKGAAFADLEAALGRLGGAITKAFRARQDVGQADLAGDAVAAFHANQALVESERQIAAEQRNVAAQAEVVNAVASDPAMRVAFDQARGVLTSLDRQFDSTTGKVLKFGGAGAEAARGTASELADLVTQYQLASGAEQKYLEQLINLRKAEGLVQGVKLDPSNIETSREATLRLIEAMREAGLDGTKAFQSLVDMLKQFNEGSIEAADRQKALGAGGAPTPALDAAEAQAAAQERAAHAALEARVALAGMAFDAVKVVETAIETATSYSTLTQVIESVGVGLDELNAKFAQIQQAAIRAGSPEALAPLLEQMRSLNAQITEQEGLLESLQKKAADIAVPEEIPGGAESLFRGLIGLDVPQIGVGVSPLVDFEAFFDEVSTKVRSMEDQSVVEVPIKPKITMLDPISIKAEAFIELTPTDDPEQAFERTFGKQMSIPVLVATIPDAASFDEFRSSVVRLLDQFSDEAILSVKLEDSSLEDLEEKLSKIFSEGNVNPELRPQFEKFLRIQEIAEEAHRERAARKDHERLQSLSEEQRKIELEERGRFNKRSFISDEEAKRLNERERLINERADARREAFEKPFEKRRRRGGAGGGEGGPGVGRGGGDSILEPFAEAAKAAAQDFEIKAPLILEPLPFVGEDVVKASFGDDRVVVPVQPKVQGEEVRKGLEEAAERAKIAVEPDKNLLEKGFSFLRKRMEQASEESKIKVEAEGTEQAAGFLDRLRAKAEDLVGTSEQAAGEGLFGGLKQDIEEFRKVTSSLAKVAESAEHLARTVDVFNELLKDPAATRAFVEAVTGVDAILDKTTATVAFLSTAIREGLPVAAELAKDALADLTAALLPVAGAAADVFVGVLDGVLATLDRVRGAFAELVSGIASQLSSLASNPALEAVPDAIGGPIRDQIIGLATTFGNLSGEIRAQDPFAGLSEDLKGKVEESKKVVASVAEDAFGKGLPAGFEAGAAGEEIDAHLDKLRELGNAQLEAAKKARESQAAFEIARQELRKSQEAGPPRPASLLQGPPSAAELESAKRAQAIADQSERLRQETIAAKAEVEATARAYEAEAEALAKIIGLSAEARSREQSRFDLEKLLQASQAEGAERERAALEKRNEVIERFKQLQQEAAPDGGGFAGPTPGVGLSFPQLGVGGGPLAELAQSAVDEAFAGSPVEIPAALSPAVDPAIFSAEATAALAGSAVTIALSPDSAAVEAFIADLESRRIEVGLDFDEAAVRRLVNLLSIDVGLAAEAREFNEELSSAVDQARDLVATLKEAKIDPGGTVAAAGSSGFTVNVSLGGITVQVSGGRDDEFDSTKRDQITREVSRVLEEQVFPAINSAFRGGRR